MIRRDLEAIFALFDIPGDQTFQLAEEFGSGHINDTFRINTKQSNNKGDGTPSDNLSQYYILQRINHAIFTRPVQVMDNIHRVTAHLSAKISSRGGDPLRETLTLLPTKAGRWYEVDGGGNYWRVFRYIGGATTYDIIEDERHVTAAARAFAEFQRDVSDLPTPRLHETIPGFGDTAFRFEQFQAALKSDCKGRAGGCVAEIEFCLAREGDASVLTDLLRQGKIPERITHYDTKINNVMIDDSTGRGICVLDLDTVMPGVAMYDFGDAVRTAAALAAEDETDLSKVGFSMDRFERLAEGYLSVANDFLTDVEMDHLAFAARIVALTIGLRFLTDH
eukprot:CAMPEP_0113582112 /NCGR_PEP_ID=MMETSP0015_2-20120614/31711_1 /TAXON_ID=2838 /ORGANISM="Odontella" /LENGTH=334 /DNA_ID=CAMNT_0000486703 /DNA_START=98 /DNA_END=1099 /DNA_ORIENTATION=- /assembly_acc=CAM_ASM_000160